MQTLKVNFQIWTQPCNQLGSSSLSWLRSEAGHEAILEANLEFVRDGDNDLEGVSLVDLDTAPGNTANEEEV